MRSDELTLERFYRNHEPLPSLRKRYISLWNGWLGKADYHKIDKVTPLEFSKFEAFTSRLFENYELFLVNLDRRVLDKVCQASELIENFESDKTSSEFTKIYIPELESMITEEWDFTYIFWFRDSNAIPDINKIVSDSGLFLFGDDNV